MEPSFQAMVDCMLETAGRAERAAARDRPRLSAPAGRENVKTQSADYREWPTWWQAGVFSLFLEQATEGPEQGSVAIK